jgi:4-hydroxybenzoate polyprenyltransferase
MCDTIYACQDIKDDTKAGVKSTALLFGDNVREFLVIFATIFVASLAAAGNLNEQSTVYYVVACGGAMVYFVWQFATWNVNDPVDCDAKFKVRAKILESSAC